MTSMKMPERGEGWRHHNGTLYEIVGVGHAAGTADAVVIYRTVDYERPHWDGLWSRSLSSFLGYTEDHSRRFTFERTKA